MKDVIVVGVACPWSTQAETQAALSGVGLSFGQGGVLADYYEPYGDILTRALEGRIDADERRRVASHRGVLRVGAPTGQESALFLTATVDRVLAAGGLAVMVETSGATHGAAAWRKLTQEAANPFSLHDAFVFLTGNERLAYGSGMGAFALPDAYVVDPADPTQALGHIHLFDAWRLAYKPELESGHTVDLMDKLPPFTVTLTADPNFEADDPFHNPHGAWRLTPVARA